MLRCSVCRIRVISHEQVGLIYTLRHTRIALDDRVILGRVYLHFLRAGRRMYVSFIFMSWSSLENSVCTPLQVYFNIVVIHLGLWLLQDIH